MKKGVRTRQSQVGEVTRAETRRQVLRAAQEEFAERGYAAATMARIAERADVAVQTLYSAWGSKRELLRGVMLTSVSGDDETRADARRAPVTALHRVPAELSGDPKAAIAYLAHEFRLLCERATVGWQTYRDAAAVDPRAADDWHELMTMRRAAFRDIIAQLPAKWLRRGLSSAGAADTAWVIASPETCDQLMRRAGYGYDQLEEWVRTTLCAALLE